MNKNQLFGLAAVVLPLLSVPYITLAHDAEQEHARHGGNHNGTQSKRSMRDAIVWTDLPILKVMAGGGMRAQREVTLLPKNVSPNSIDAYSANIKAADAHRELAYDLVTAKLGKPSTGGFFWLSAREDQPDKVIVASSVYYMSERGSKNPTAMFMQQKNALEIIPQPFPREHSRYRANEDWKFLVRYHSKPLAQQKVNMVTQNGSKKAFVSDAKGIFVAHIPDDFHTTKVQKAVEARHSHGRKSAEFVLATEYKDDGKTYLTGFNSSYGPDAFDQRSLAAGLGFMLLGMVGAAPLLRHRRVTKKAVVPETEKKGL